MVSDEYDIMSMGSWMYTENKDAQPWDWDLEEYSYSMNMRNPDQGCAHEWVNVSFNHVRLACKHCGVDKEG